MKLNVDSIIEQTIAGLLVILLAGIVALFQRKNLGKILAGTWKWTSRNWHVIVLLIIASLASWILFTYPETLLTLLTPFLLVLITFLISKQYLNSQISARSQYSKPNSIESSNSKISRFSQYLDAIMEPVRKDISGTGLRFLNALKKSPPFLDSVPDVRILSVQQEQVLMEFFHALEFVEQYRDNFRGGSLYTVKEGEDLESIAQTIYGDSKYKEGIQDANPIGHRLLTGMVIELPLIDIAHPELPSSFLKSQVLKAEEDDKLRSVFASIRDEQGLLGNEVMPLLKLVYKAARMTMLK
jgi:hypothetical protein